MTTLGRGPRCAWAWRTRQLVRSGNAAPQIMGTIITLLVICQIVSATRFVMSEEISIAATVFFNFKYSSSLIAKSFEEQNDSKTTMDRFELDLQDAIVADLETWTSTLVTRNRLCTIFL